MVNHGGPEVRKSLNKYIRTPIKRSTVGEVIDEIARWKRAQRQAQRMGMEKLANADYLEAFLDMVRPLKERCSVTKTLLELVEAEEQSDVPSDDWIKKTERRIMSQLRMLKTGDLQENRVESSSRPMVYQAEQDETVPQVPSGAEQRRSAATQEATNDSMLKMI